MKYRTIHHLSSPRKGKSINSGIAEDYISVSYILFKQVVAMILNLGVGAYIWKIDLDSAYRQLMVHPDFWHLLGLKWDGLFLVDTRLPFGLASSCNIFTQFADSILWILKRKYYSVFKQMNGEEVAAHYLDDFFGGDNSLEISLEQYNALHALCRYLGVKASKKKSFPPSQLLVILGFLYNTLQMTVSIPTDRAHDVARRVQILLGKRTATKKELLSIIGSLRWMSYVIFPGAAFVRNLEQVANSVSQLSHHVNINNIRREQLSWWLFAIDNLNAIPMQFILKNPDDGDITIYTDASDKGLGGYSKDIHKCFAAAFSAQLVRERDIQWRELCAITLAVLLWGKLFRDKAVSIFCDNNAVHWCLKKKCSSLKRQDLQRLILIICASAVKHRFYFYSNFIPGEENVIADFLSRNPDSTGETKNKFMIDLIPHMEGDMKFWMDLLNSNSSYASVVEHSV